MTCAHAAPSVSSDQGPIHGIRTRAAVVEEAGGSFVFRDVQLSGPRPDQVVVQVEASGMCHADLADRAGTIPFPLPAILGHEAVGRVVEIGSSVTDIAVGDRVVVSFSYCGCCPACLRSAPVYCADWPRLNMVEGARAHGSSTLLGSRPLVRAHFFGQSSFSSMLLTTAPSAVKVPEDLPARILAPLGCGIETGVSAVTQVLKPATGARVAVFGVGTLGMSALMALQLTAATQRLPIDKIITDFTFADINVAAEQSLNGTVI